MTGGRELDRVNVGANAAKQLTRDLEMPQLGDTVKFTFDATRAARIEAREPGVMEKYGQSVTVPATVVAIWSDTCVNLRVHPDGPGPDLWETSVTMNDGLQDSYYWELI